MVRKEKYRVERKFRLVIRWLDGYEVVYYIKPNTLLTYEVNYISFINKETESRVFIPLMHIRHWEEVDY